jgi:hypothetical protein
MTPKVPYKHGSIKNTYGFNGDGIASMEAAEACGVRTDAKNTHIERYEAGVVSDSLSDVKL